MVLTSRWIAATGQTWKLLVLYVLTLVGMVMALGGLVPSVGHFVTRDRVLVFDFCGMYGPLWFGWIALAVRCPKCTRRTGWWYVQNTGVTEWFTWCVSASRCPVGGYQGETHQHATPESEP